MSRIASSSYFILRHPEAYSWASSVAPEGVVDGVVGLDVSKTEGIKASVAWVSPANRASAWCFRRVFVVFPVRFGVALHGTWADLLRFGHLAPSLRHADIRAGPSPQRVGLGWDARGRVSIVVDEGLRRQREFGADREGRALIIGDEAGVEGNSPR